MPTGHHRWLDSGQGTQQLVPDILHFHTGTSTRVLFTPEAPDTKLNQCTIVHSGRRTADAEQVFTVYASSGFSRWSRMNASTLSGLWWYFERPADSI